MFSTRFSYVLRKHSINVKNCHIVKNIPVIHLHPEIYCDVDVNGQSRIVNAQFKSYPEIIKNNDKGEKSFSNT